MIKTYFKTLRGPCPPERLGWGAAAKGGGEGVSPSEVVSQEDKARSRRVLKYLFVLGTAVGLLLLFLDSTGIFTQERMTKSEQMSEFVNDAGMGDWLVHEARLKLATNLKDSACDLAQLSQLFEGGPQKSIAILKDACETRTDNTSVATEAEKFVQYFRSGDLAQARLELKKKIEEEPDNKNARAMLSDIERRLAQSEAGKKAGASDVDLTGMLTKTRELKNSGLYLDAFRLVDKVATLSSASPNPAATESLVQDLRGEISDEVKEKKVSQIGSLTREALKTSDLDPENALKRLVSIKKSYSDVFEILPNEPTVKEFERQLSNSIQFNKDRWFARVKSVEGLKGCDAATPMYQKMKSAFSEMSIELDEIDEGVKRCDIKQIEKK